MIEKLIHRLLLRRHFWRYVTLSEITELYAARLLRITAISLISVMSAVYMYKNGYPIIQIVGAYAGYFVFKVLISYPLSLVIARFGPKHGMFFANVLMIPSLLFFLTLPVVGIWALIGHLLLNAISIALYDMAHLISFSKIKSVEHAGRELGFMNVVDKVATGLSPVVGGVIAWVFGPNVTIVIASVFFLLSAIPLLRSAEPVKTRQKIVFKGFPWSQAWRSFVAESALGVDNAALAVLWQLFLVIAVLTSGGNEVYAEIGVLASISIIVGLIAPRIYGRLVDRRHGYDLLRYGVLTNSMIHMVRPLITTPVSAGMINVAQEVAGTATAMSFMRGMFDLADRSGHRIAYILIIEIAFNLGSALMCFIAVFLLFSLGDQLGLSISFMIVGLLTLLIGSAKFPLYR